ncbi:MAG TPA: hypothetical protein VNF75_03495 [Candidatus Dormibacteraeota bacterium]|nr:hypothetical protein [Candidatus Dormibacteraeota bacterium]
MPASEIRSFEVTIPAGTSQAGPQVTDLVMPPRVVVQIDIKVPAGARGQMGFALWASGLTVIPEQPGQFIVTDDEQISWPLQDQIDSGGWQLAGYNLGQYDHVVYVRFLVLPTTVPALVAVLQPIPAASLSSSG